MFAALLAAVLHLAAPVAAPAPVVSNDAHLVWHVGDPKIISRTFVHSGRHTPGWHWAR